MQKKCRLLSTVLCLLFLYVPLQASAQGQRDEGLQAAFESGSLLLEETQLIPDYTGYTLRASAAAYDQMVQMEGTVPALQAEGDFVTLEINNQDFHPDPCYFSPDGSKAILMDEKHAYLLADKNITMILPNYTRGVPDTYAVFSHNLKKNPSLWVNTEGIAWSPDGRYAVLTNYWQSFMFQNLQGLYILDTELGEIFLADAYSTDYHKGGVATVIQASYDISGRYLYYTIYSQFAPDIYIMLMRYDMETGEKKQLYACPKSAAFPKLKLDPKGRLVYLTNNVNPHFPLGINVLEQKDDTWTSNTFEFSQPGNLIRPKFMDLGGSGIGILLQWLQVASLGRQFSLPGRFLTDDGLTGYNDLLLIEGLDAKEAIQMPLSECGDGRALADRILKGEVLQCLNIQLSPDGYYALLLVTDGKAYNFMVMDLNTLAISKVDTPKGMASRQALCGDKPNNVYPSGIGWFEGNKVVILTEEGLKLYEFAY